MDDGGEVLAVDRNDERNSSRAPRSVGVSLPVSHELGVSIPTPSRCSYDATYQCLANSIALNDNNLIQVVNP